MDRFGNDFNASRPTEGDFVRHATKAQMATELREIKRRLKVFFGGGTSNSLSYNASSNTIYIPILH